MIDHQYYNQTSLQKSSFLRFELQPSSVSQSNITSVKFVFGLVLFNRSSVYINIIADFHCIQCGLSLCENVNQALILNFWTETLMQTHKL